MSEFRDFIRHFALISPHFDEVLFTKTLINSIFQTRISSVT